VTISSACFEVLCGFGLLAACEFCPQRLPESRRRRPQRPVGSTCQVGLNHRFPSLAKGCDGQAHECSRLNLVIGHPEWQASPSDPCRYQRVLGEIVCNAPSQRRYHSEVTVPGSFRVVFNDNLDVLGERRPIELLLLQFRERMTGRHYRSASDGNQRFKFDRRMNQINTRDR
jgi:hypothetical protein